MIFKYKFMCFVVLFGEAFSQPLCHFDDVHALILARGGSKGIRGKNLITINEISALAQTITTIRKTGLFEHIWVSTDSQAIEDEAFKYGALVHRRDQFYAQDTTTSLESVKEFLDSHSTVSRFALFQCTSVFLKEQYIVEAFERFQGKDCVFAVTRSHKLRWTEANGKVIPLNFNPIARPRRQDWHGELIETGMFYFSSRNLIEQNRFQNERCSVVEVDAKDSLEIDTINDVVLARCINKINKNS